MAYALDKNGNFILNENGDKIEFNVSYEYNDEWYKHKEPIHIDDNGFIHTEDRCIVIKDGYKSDHAISKRQLDEINNSKYSKEDIDNKLLALENKITASINSLKSQINELRILIGYNKMNNHMPSNFNSNR